MLYISVANPLPPRTAEHRHEGNRMALANIRERLLLAYGERARLAIDATAESFQVTVLFPRLEEAA